MLEFEFDELIGKTLVDVKQSYNSVVFITDQGEQYEFCEPGGYGSVELDDVCGDWASLLNSPLLMAEKAFNDGGYVPVAKDGSSSYTWTFFKFATATGYVTMRWYGSSNGYYSEDVAMNRLENVEVGN